MRQFKSLADAGVLTQATEDLALCLTERFWHAVPGTPLEGRAVFVKSIHGGGGRGTVKVANVSREGATDPVLSAIRRCMMETGRTDGIYAEVALDLAGASLYQLEMEVDGGMVVDGGRLVYFNSRNQKMIELGFSEEELVKFLPADVYKQCMHSTKKIAEFSKYEGRGTNEILIAKMANGQWKIYCSEFNKRIQVEHKALSALKRYKDSGEYFNTVADQVMRACGYRPPDYRVDLAPSGDNAIAHIRLIAPNITPAGDISFPPGVDVDGVMLGTGFSALVHTGKLQADTDAQFGCSIIAKPTWDSLVKACQEFSLSTVIQGENISRDYMHFLQQFFHHPKVADLSLGCNRTFDVLKLGVQFEESRMVRINQFLTNGVARCIVNGYRPDEGVKNRQYPTKEQLQRFTELRYELFMTKMAKGENTPFLSYLDHLDEKRYYSDLRRTIGRRGGAMVSVFPRDVQQEGSGSESHLITFVCRMLMERYGLDAGFIGYEMGGAQFQTAEMNLISSSRVLAAGLLSNAPTFSLTRSHWMNGLEKLSREEIQYVLEATADIVRRRFHLEKFDRTDGKVTPLPYFPYNFHAGNVEGQDEVTGLMLDVGFTPVPNFVWDPRFTQEHLTQWVTRQLNLWKSKGRKLEMLRIKNAGQTEHWTARNVWAYVDTIRRVYRQFYAKQENRAVGNGGDGSKNRSHNPAFSHVLYEVDENEPIIQIHNHNFNGLASHVGAELFKLAQSNGYRYLVVDTAPPGMTHNNALVVSKSLDMTPEERQALHKYNEGAHIIWELTERFRDFPLLRIDPYTIWAGGTGSSDITAAAKQGIPRHEIEDAKRLGAQISGLGGIVTPYSQWSMVIGYAAFKAGLKTFDAFLKHVEGGGIIPLPPNIIQGLDRWETLLARPPHVVRLLENFRSTQPNDLLPGGGGGEGEAEAKKQEDLENNTKKKNKTTTPTTTQGGESGATSSTTTTTTTTTRQQTDTNTEHDDPLFVRRAKEALQQVGPAIPLSRDNISRFISYGNFGVKCIKAEYEGNSNDWLLRYPEMAYGKASDTEVGKVFAVLGVPVTLMGIERDTDTAGVTVTFKVEGHLTRARTTDRFRAAQLDRIIEKAQHTADVNNPLHVGAFMPGLVENVRVKLGQKIRAGDILYSINSMKMVMNYQATKEQDGKTVATIYVSQGEELNFKPQDPPPLVIQLAD